MLTTQDEWETSLVSRTLERFYKRPGHRCFKYICVSGAYLFHVDTLVNASLANGWVHYVTGSVEGLLELIECGVERGWKLQISLQTPFSRNSPYVTTRILELLMGYDTTRQVHFYCKCANGQSYALTSADPKDLPENVRVWP